MSAILDEPELLEAASALEPGRFEQFVKDILRVRAGRTARTLRADESAFLARINGGPSAEVWTESRRLRERLQQDTLTPAEHAELLRLTDILESYQADRAAALTDLAALRGQPLTELMDSLGIRGPVAE